MADLSAFKITQRWPAKDPDVIQLYSLPTPNGIKVSAMRSRSSWVLNPVSSPERRMSSSTLGRVISVRANRPTV